MAKSLKTCNGSRKSLRKGRKSLRKGRKSVKRGKGFRKSVKRGKGFRKMYGGTPLTEFLIKNNKPLNLDEIKQLSKLLMNKSLINQPHEEGENKGFTPLHILCSLKTLNPPMIKMLIKRGANVNVTIDNAEVSEDNGLTPLDVLIDFQSNIQWNSTAFKEIMTVLLEYGGSYNEKLINKAGLYKDEKKEYIKNIQNNIQTDIKNEISRLFEN